MTMNELRSRAMELAPMLKAIKDDLHHHPEEARRCRQEARSCR